MYLQSRYARVAVACILTFALTASAGGANGISPLVPASASASSSSMTRASAMSAGSSASSATAAIPFPAAPDPDPFYRQPNPFPNLANGTILLWRSVTYKPDGTPMPNQAWQLKFVSRDGNGQPIAAVATVVKPLLPASGVHPLLAFGFAEDGLGAQCAPSHGVTGSTADSNEQLETTVPTAGLNMGWTVVYPDYEGPSSEYAAGRLEGQVTLDSVRAAEQFAPLGLSAQTPVGLAGYSGGAIAVAWAATLQHSYAPRLNIAGVASGGTPADIAGILKNIDSNPVANAAFFAVIFMAAVGINRAYPRFLTPILNAKGVAAATSIENGCIGKQSNGYAGPTGTFANYETTTNPYVTPGYVATLPLVTLPQRDKSPVANVFVYHSQTDELIPVAGVDAMVRGWCAAGSHVEYYRALSGDHVSTELDSAQFVLAYLSSRFKQTPTVTPAGSTTCN